MTDWHVLIIGGGATGAALVHDLTLRGLKVTLVERHEVASGTTVRHHSLLRSGARYAVKNQESTSESQKKSPKTAAKPYTAQGDPWISVRAGLLFILLLSVGLGLFVGWQVAPVSGWGEAARWSLLATLSIWVVFGLAFVVSRALRRSS